MNRSICGTRDTASRPPVLRTVMANSRQICESLELARSLLRELIQVHEAHEPGPTPKLFLPILVHLANIHKLVAASGEPSNAIKRLRDFALTIERRTLRDGESGETQSLRRRLVATLRLVADQLNADAAADNGAVEPQAAAIQ
jgi:hypothetical protein